MNSPFFCVICHFLKCDGMSFFIATMPDDAENKVARYTKNAAAG